MAEKNFYGNNGQFKGSMDDVFLNLTGREIANV